MVLSPRSTGGPGRHTSTQNLNPELRSRSNPAGAHLTEREFAAGDRVINVANDYQLEVMNGEIGRVAASRRTATERVIEVSFPDRQVTYHDDEIDRHLRLAYALSCHKAQGGEAAAVLVLFGRADGLLLYRRLAYTAISRARQTALVLAEAGALEAAIANRRDQRRHGLLSTRIKGLL
jgi:exodeoxyribonuclease V alpha subunit